MRRRGVLALGGVAVLMALLAVGAVARYLLPQLQASEFAFDGTEDQAEMEAYYAWINSGWPFYSMVPWLVLAALLAAVAALALAARRAQLQLAGSASATASRVASSAASVSAGSAESIS